MKTNSEPIKLVHIVTSPTTAWSFLRGQLRYMRERGMEVTVIASPGKALDEVAQSEGVNTIAVPAVTKKVRATHLVPTIKNGKKLVVHGKVVTHRVSYLKKVVVTPAVAGATGTFVSNFNPDSQATLNALPAS